jgi:DNA-directed RNA polymerase subunit RPC12/RpoP
MPVKIPWHDYQCVECEANFQGRHTDKNGKAAPVEPEYDCLLCGTKNSGKHKIDCKGCKSG